MSVLKSYRFPLRLTAATVAAVYPSLEAAFAAHDHLYVARFGRAHPELHGCALLMLGNRVGGEAILDAADIRSFRACFYRAYAAWQDDDRDQAHHWLTAARQADPTDPRPDRLQDLMRRTHFNIAYQVNFSEDAELDAFRDLPDFSVCFLRPAANDPNQVAINLPLAEQLPAGFKPDLVLIDNLTLIPVGVGELEAPVVVGIHDCEYDYEFLDEVLPEIDLLSVGSTTEMIELARPFKRNATVYFYPIPLRLPKDDRRSLSERFADQTGHTEDLVHTGGIGADFYRHKRQEILGLTRLDRRFSVHILGTRFSIATYWQQMRRARFSIMSSRYCNSMATRTFDALLCGTLSLVDEENGLPYMFSRDFACFPTYRRDSLLTDVEKHLNNYDAIIAAFKPQLPQFEAEFNSLFPDDKKRTRRYLRHLLFMTGVDYNTGKTAGRAPSARKHVYFNEYDFLHLNAATLAQLSAQTPHHHYLRRALTAGKLALAQHQANPQSVTEINRVVEQGLAATPQSLALHYMHGLCQRYLNNDKEAAKDFRMIGTGNLELSPLDPTVNRFGRHHSHYWIADARVRARCASDVAPLVPVEDVFKSYALANLADIALSRALAFQQEEKAPAAIAGFTEALALAQQALTLLMYNDSAERTCLRAVFALALLSDEKWNEIFRQSFAIACANDVMVLHDGAALAVHMCMQAGRQAEAEAIRADLARFLSRTDLLDYEFTLYPEAIPFHNRYQIPHKRMDAFYPKKTLV